MRHLKKLLSHEMLHLTLVLSLLRVDPDALMFGPGPGSGRITDYLDDAAGDVWTQTRYPDLLSGLSEMSPTLHHKSVDAMVERFHTDIMDDLNNLGRYDLGRYPVEIAAYVLNTNLNPTRASNHSVPVLGHEGTGDSDSGISDTELNPSNFGSESSDEGDSDREEVSTPDEGNSDFVIEPLLNLSQDEDNELELVGNPQEVLGQVIGDAAASWAPAASISTSPAEFLPDREDLENELVHIDDQLITIEDNLEDINDTFLHFDEQLAVHLEEDDDISESSALLDMVGFDANPFDEWQMETNADLEQLLRDSNELLQEEERLVSSNNIFKCTYKVCSIRSR